MRFRTGLLFVLLISGCTARTVSESLKADIDSISRKFVPDTREGICNIKLERVPGNIIKISGETDQPELRKEISEILEKLGLKYQDSISLLPDTSMIFKRWGLVTVSVINIKKNPSHSSELISQAIMGTPVKILKQMGSWILIQTPDHYIGWVTRSSISEMDENEFGRWKQCERVIYTSKSGDIVTGKNVVSDIVAGVILEVKNKTAGWFNVVLPDGREGSIPAGDAADFNRWVSEIKPVAADMISMGRSLLGSPYMWGGTSVKALDCSGFVKTLYFLGGIILARDASQQFRYGAPLNITETFESLIPGDLIFFGRLNEKGEKRITHVGMYIGDTEVIHSSGMVRINSLDPSRANYSSYLKETLMGSRRVIGAGDEQGTRSVKNHGWYID